MNGFRLGSIALLISWCGYSQVPRIGGCPVFPSNNIWNTPIDAMPVDGRSANWVNSITPTGTLRWDAVIPITVVPGSQPKVPMNITYPAESDAGPYPYPPNAGVEPGDKHVIVIDRDNCVLYESYNSVLQPDGSWNVESSAKWSLLSNALRPLTWTSADAAGLPIAPGLVRYDEIVAGEINHAIRFTAPRTQRLFVWPGRHFASTSSSALLPPMGQRFRLKAGFDVSPYPPSVQVILRAMKKYGIMLADNGLPWEMQLASDSRWNEDELVALRSIAGSNLEAVDVSSLMVDPDSGQAGPCTVTFPSTVFSDARAQVMPVTVKADGGCGWSFGANSAWLATGASSFGAGDGAINLSVGANGSNAPRTGILTINGASVAVVQRATTGVYTDVGPENDFFDAINWGQQLGLTQACSAAPAFCPDVNATRGEIAASIVRSVMGGDDFSYNPVPYFLDAPAGHPYFKWIQKLKELGITNGCTATMFCPSLLVTRGQSAAFVIRARYGTTAAFSYPPAPFFGDVPVNHDFFRWIQKMKQIGITSGCQATQYCPESPVTRGQMSMFVMRGGYNRLLPDTTPVLTAVSLTGAAAGQMVTVTITGRNTHFRSGATQISAGDGVAAGSVIVVDAATLIVQLQVAGNAAPGPRTITATTDGEDATLPNAFRVQ